MFNKVAYALLLSTISCVPLKDSVDASVAFSQLSQTSDRALDSYFEWLDENGDGVVT